MSSNIRKTEELALQAGMQFEEAAELFSDETLKSMVMIHIMGGRVEEANYCEGGNCKNCGDCWFCFNWGNCNDNGCTKSPS